MWIEQTDTGDEVVSLDDAKRYLKVTSNNANEDIALMLEAATAYGERFTGRDFRANTYALHLDAFSERICLKKNPVDSITTITRLVGGNVTVVTAADYYLKKGLRWSEVLLADGASWPTDQDPIEDTVVVNFITTAYKNPELYKLAILKHVAYSYENRGDDGNPSGSGRQQTMGPSGGRSSGANGLYLTMRIPRI